jgi:hypothetical protein
MRGAQPLSPPLDVSGPNMDEWAIGMTENRDDDA